MVQWLLIGSGLHHSAELLPGKLCKDSSTTQDARNALMQLRLKNYLKRLLPWIEKWRWVILVLIGLSLLWVEVQEFWVLKVLDQPFHYFEVFQYAVLLISTGSLIELFSRASKAHRQALKILEYKHRLSMEFTANADWELLTAKLAELPGRIADVAEAYLLVSNPISDKFEIVSRWTNGVDTSETETWDPTVPCQACFAKMSGKKTNFHLCRSNNDLTTYHAYSLGIVDPDLHATALKFKLKPGGYLSKEEHQIFISIGDEIAVALRASQDRRRLAELQSTQVAMAERRMVSAYVHDQLGQNLGYLHLKLDQLGNKSTAASKELRSELKQLRSVANESYEIVRDILKKMQPETVPHLANILQEHARKISQRANFSLNFRCMGGPVGLLPDAQQIIFYTFHEILNNIEKHAKANKVDVLVIWNDGFLDISVADNGVGFDSQANGKNQHFGLEIMQERIAKLNGRLTINSSANSGTLVSVSVPLHQISEGHHEPRR